MAVVALCWVHLRGCLPPDARPSIAEVPMPNFDVVVGIPSYGSPRGFYGATGDLGLEEADVIPSYTLNTHWLEETPRKETSNPMFTLHEVAIPGVGSVCSLGEL